MHLAWVRRAARPGSEVPGRREQSAGEAAWLQPGKLFGGEPGDVGELIVADGRGTIDDRGLVHRGDVGGTVPVRVADLIVRPPSTSSRRTSRTSTPISSRVSRTAASAGDSPTSTAPPSTPHPSLWPACRTSSSRPAWSTGSTETDGSRSRSCPTAARSRAMCAGMLTLAPFPGRSMSKHGREVGWYEGDIGPCGRRAQ